MLLLKIEIDPNSIDTMHAHYESATYELISQKKEAAYVR